ncbi:hypothetical protein [Fuchsiella alkaliacetigena]|uniref:hypothetical protein n=1 Tax=Fuchsiella alkaliacetigena TaxID=957042 RepID=UPI00200B61BC|nr:hypothetical protein [Fuchsiella alkaliacetigena]MCK8824731.1 hypothetical protein [Fuchsiella alkaliacetigena]
MKLITDVIENYLGQLKISDSYGPVDKVKSYGHLKDLKGVDYGLAYQLDTGQAYKNRKMKFDDLLFIHGFSPNIRSAYYLRPKIIQHLDKSREDLEDENIYVYSCRYRNKEGTPKKNKVLELWEVVVSFDIRWEVL